MSAATDFDPSVRPAIGSFGRAVADESAQFKPNAPSGEFGFDDLLDIVNPLQHLPVIGTIYREITGDSIQPASRVVGGLLFGGPLGFASSLANVVIEEATGRDIGDSILAGLIGDDDGLASQNLAELPASDGPAVPTPGSVPTPGPALASDLAAPPPQPARPQPTAPVAAAVPAAADEAPVANGTPVPASQADGDRGALTGDAALRALAADMGLLVPQQRPSAAGVEVPPAESFRPLEPCHFSGKRPAAATPPLPDPHPGPATRPRAAASALPTAPAAPGGVAAVPSAADPRFAAAETPQNHFADQMMQALLKYQAMQEE